MTDSLLQQQLDIEASMVRFGRDRYIASQKNSIDKGRFEETDAANLMIQQTIDSISTTLEQRLASATKGRNVRALTLLTHRVDGVRVSLVDASVAMYLALSVALSKSSAEFPLTTLVTVIATTIEDEIRFSQFEDNYGAYYSKIKKGFSDRNSTNYRYKHRVLTSAANSLDDGTGDGWEPWGESDKVMVGTYLLDIILSGTVFIKTYRKKRRGGGYQLCVALTATAMELMDKVNSFRMFLSPPCLPMIVPPKPWTSMEDGGYYSPQASKRYKFVKRSFKTDMNIVADAINAGDAAEVMKAVNIIQATPWTVNNRVYDTLLDIYGGSYGVGLPSLTPIDIPKWTGDRTTKKADMTEIQLADFQEWAGEASAAHTAERERHDACRTFARTLDLTQRFKDYEYIYFPHNCDFRGRFYAASSGLTPQGDDIGKSLLHFGNGQTINKRGAYWLAVQGANTYGEDKISFDAREQWVIDNTAAIRATAQDPVGNRGFWGSADKPWQFLAFCFEWDGYCREGFKHVTQLPIALDGSCNGLQHYSALLGDSIGASATNLISTTVPSDIYQTVATVCSAKVNSALGKHSEVRDLLLFWDSVVLDRKLAKKPVMTLPYGSTRLTCADSIIAWLKDNEYGVDALGRSKLAWALTPLLWDSIGEVVVAAREGMDWLKSVSRELSRDNAAIVWSTKLGFPIVQRSLKMTSVQIRTQLMGSTFRPCLDVPTDRIDSMKQANGIAPNFTHGNDATHLAMTVLDQGPIDVAMIHDSFGCHANGIDAMHVSIRKTFATLYKGTEVLDDFVTSTGTTIPYPDRGTYDVNDIADATYFFG